MANEQAPANGTTTAGTSNTTPGSTSAASTTAPATNVDGAAALAANQQPTEQAATTPNPDAGQSTAAPKADETKPDATTALASKPIEYTDFVLPEGTSLAPETVTSVADLAKELQLPQDQAQKVVDKAAQLGKQFNTNLEKQIADTKLAWLEQTKTDPEIGGDRLYDTLATAKKAVDAFGDTKFTELLNNTGLGNHPDFVRVFNKIGRAISEDTLVQGGMSVAAAPLSYEDRLYGNKKT